MPEGSFDQFFSRKAYEISYAAFRIAAAMRLRGLSEEITREAAEFLGATARRDYGESRKMAVALEYLLRLASDAGAIAQKTAFLALEEINRFISAFDEYSASLEPPAVSLEGIFSQAPAHLESPPPRERNKEEDLEMAEPIMRQSHGRSPEGRHAAILGVIRRQNGNCRLKDIQDALPEASERTLRYDVQDLIDQGVVERVGNGGPHMRYKARDGGVSNL